MGQKGKRGTMGEGKRGTMEKGKGGRKKREGRREEKKNGSCPRTGRGPPCGAADRSAACPPEGLHLRQLLAGPSGANTRAPTSKLKTRLALRGRDPKKWVKQITSKNAGFSAKSGRPHEIRKSSKDLVQKSACFLVSP